MQVQGPHATPHDSLLQPLSDVSVMRKQVREVKEKVGAFDIIFSL
jgi:hypothetical protein